MKALNAHSGGKQFLYFLLSGGIAASVNLSSRVLFSQFVEFHIAVCMAFMCGLSTGFVLSKIFVFKDSRNGTQLEIGYYVAINMAALLQTWAISVYLAEYFFTPKWGKETGEAIAHFIGVGAPVLTSFIGHKYLTFRK